LTTFPTQKLPPNDPNQASKLKFYFVLLTDATATSQQLRITRNNFRLSACDECCVLLLAVLSTACSAAAHGRSAGVVGEEKEKN
jgi:recombinational DNA repair protein RecR